MISEEANLEMVSHFGEHPGEGEVSDKGNCSDYWFQSDSGTTGYELSTMSALVGRASYASPYDNSGWKISNMLSEMCYFDIEMNRYYADDIMLTNSMEPSSAGRPLRIRRETKLR